MPDGLEGGQSALLYRYHVVVGIARDQLAHGIDTCFSRQLIDRDSEVAPVLIDLLLLQVEEFSVGVYDANVDPVVDRNRMLLSASIGADLFRIDRQVNLVLAVGLRNVVGGESTNIVERNSPEEIFKQVLIVRRELLEVAFQLERYRIRPILERKRLQKLPDRRIHAVLADVILQPVHHQRTLAV